MTVGDENTPAEFSDVTLIGADGHTIGGDPLAGFPDTTTDPGLTLGGSWTVLDANRPTYLVVDLTVTTDGTSAALAYISVDLSGGTTEDYRTAKFFADNDGGDGFAITFAQGSYIPAGASVKVVNNSDPKGANALQAQNLYTL